MGEFEAGDTQSEEAWAIGGLRQRRTEHRTTLLPAAGHKGRCGLPARPERRMLGSWSQSHTNISTASLIRSIRPIAHLAVPVSARSRQRFTEPAAGSQVVLSSSVPQFSIPRPGAIS